MLAFITVYYVLLYDECECLRKNYLVVQNEWEPQNKKGNKKIQRGVMACHSGVQPEPDLS
jgi:hypothetical protein